MTRTNSVTMPKFIQEKRIPKQISSAAQSEHVLLLKHEAEVDPVDEMADFIQCYTKPELDFFEFNKP